MKKVPERSHVSAMQPVDCLFVLWEVGSPGKEDGEMLRDKD